MAHLIALADLAVILQKADVQYQPAHVTTNCPLTGKQCDAAGSQPVEVAAWRLRLQTQRERQSSPPTLLETFAATASKN